MYISIYIKLIYLPFLWGIYFSHNFSLFQHKIFIITSVERCLVFPSFRFYFIFSVSSCSSSFVFVFLSSFHVLCVFILRTVLIVCWFVSMLWRRTTTTSFYVRRHWQFVDAINAIAGERAACGTSTIAIALIFIASFWSNLSRAFSIYLPSVYTFQTHCTYVCVCMSIFI